MQAQLEEKDQVVFRTVSDPDKVMEECEDGVFNKEKGFLANWSKGHNQIWFIRKIKNGNTYQFGCKAHQKKNLVIFNSFKGSHVHITNAFNKDDQKWVLQPKGNGPFGTIYAIRNVSSGFYLTYKGKENNVIVQKYEDTDKFKWYVCLLNPKQQQGWGPQQGQMQGQGWGPQQGQMQGQGWGPNQQQGQGWGNQPPQQGWGQGPQQGQGWGPQQGQGWGPNQQQGQGWGNQPPQQGWGNQPPQQGWGQQ